MTEPIYDTNFQENPLQNFFKRYEKMVDNPSYRIHIEPMKLLENPGYGWELNPSLMKEVTPFDSFDRTIFPYSMNINVNTSGDTLDPIFDPNYTIVNSHVKVTTNCSTVSVTIPYPIGTTLPYNYPQPEVKIENKKSLSKEEKKKVIKIDVDKILDSLKGLELQD